MLSDKANAESRMKSLEEKLTLNEDVVTKVRLDTYRLERDFRDVKTLVTIVFPTLWIFQLSRDKKVLEDKLNETIASLASEESKSKNEHRQRTKLESQLADTDSKLEREVKLKQDLEKENRKLHAEINDLQEKLALAEQRVSNVIMYALTPSNVTYYHTRDGTSSSSTP